MIEGLVRKLRAAADRRLPQHLRDARRGEDLAYDKLRREGYRIVARNYRPRAGRGEIDLLGWDGEFLACIEVKTRRSAAHGRPEEFVDSDKRRHLIRTAHDYARRASVDPSAVRFDVVSVTLEPEPKIELYRNVFSDLPDQWGRRV